MQQAYRALRVVAESQTIRIVLSPDPGGLMLSELRMVCATLNGESSAGIKAVVLDFTPDASAQDAGAAGHSQGAGAQVTQAGHPQGVSLPTSDAARVAASRVEETSAAIRGVAQPVLAVVRGTLSAAASILARSADLILAANDASLIVPISEAEEDTLTGAQAVRLGYVNWAAPANDLRREMERILDMLRGSSAIALRNTKASVRLATAGKDGNAPKTRLEALQEINTFYLAEVMHTADAHEGLQAFLEKRKPNWKNS
jgi:1,4-dihydroxy-2-naphthoyl-CoA synthase